MSGVESLQIHWHGGYTCSMTAPGVGKAVRTQSRMANDEVGVQEEGQVDATRWPKRQVQVLVD